jgi:hypothetical protein
VIGFPIQGFEHHCELVGLQDFRTAAKQVYDVCGLEALGQSRASVFVPIASGSLLIH